MVGSATRSVIGAGSGAVVPAGAAAGALAGAAGADAPAAPDADCPAGGAPAAGCGLGALLVPPQAASATSRAMLASHARRVRAPSFRLSPRRVRGPPIRCVILMFTRHPLRALEIAPLYQMPRPAG
jgi:hypothetical protein